MVSSSSATGCKTAATAAALATTPVLAPASTALQGTADLNSAVRQQEAGNQGLSVATPQAPSSGDWSSATYAIMTVQEAAELQSTDAAAAAAAAASAAEAAANAALQLGAGSGTPEAMIVHARRRSGGGANMKLVCNPKALVDDGDKPVHTLEAGGAVTEVYKHGLTIIRSLHTSNKVGSFMVHVCIISEPGCAHDTCATVLHIFS